MCMEKPVIFTKYGPGPETIDDEINGWLCEPLDPNNIAETVIKVYKKRNEFSIIGKNAREKVISKFSPDIILKQNIQFYNELINSK